MLDFFDFFMIGYVRRLSSAVGDLRPVGGRVMSAGPAPCGAFFWGWMADKVGRRKVFILTALNFSIPTG